MSAKFVRNAWYVAAWSDEIGEGLVARRILGEPVVMYRTSDGTLAALLDRCPHKLAPLSLGKKIGDYVQCGYHGLQFDSCGQCVRVPGQAQIPPSAKVRSYPVVERYRAIWIWMGDVALADPDSIIQLERYGQPGWAIVDGQYLNFKCNYLNITDNLVDPAHTTYVHATTIGNADGEDVGVKVEQTNSSVLAYRWIKNAEPVPLAKAMANFKALTDRFQYYYLHLPSISCVDFGTMDAGQDPNELNKDAGLRSFSYNFLTPETENRTHYFWLHVRNYKVDDLVAKESMISLMNSIFLEDADILAAVQIEQEATGVREYTRLAIDNAPARVRKMIDQLIAAEEAQKPPASSA